MRQNKLRVFVHFVWATWDRLPLVSEDMERGLYRYIESTCRKHDCPVLAVGGMPDHVHLLVAFSNTITIADLMEYIKGGSSRFVNEELAPGEWFKWQGSYGAFSVSPKDKSEVICYIENQKQHHTEGKLWHYAEESEEYKDREAVQ